MVWARNCHIPCRSIRHSIVQLDKATQGKTSWYLMTSHDISWHLMTCHDNISRPFDLWFVVWLLVVPPSSDSAEFHAAGQIRLCCLLKYAGADLKAWAVFFLDFLMKSKCAFRWCQHKDVLWQRFAVTFFRGKGCKWSHTCHICSYLPSCLLWEHWLSMLSTWEDAASSSPHPLWLFVKVERGRFRRLKFRWEPGKRVKESRHVCLPLFSLSIPLPLI